MAAVLVDAGPLIALLSARDEAHDACLHEAAGLKDPLLTVWPAVTEAAHFLGAEPGGVDKLLRMFATGGVRLMELSEPDMPRMRELMAKYADLPMDLADAALVAVAERENIGTVFTLDRRDFHIYRPRHTKQFKILP